MSYIYSIIHNNEIRINAMVNARRTGLIAIGVNGMDKRVNGIPISITNAKIIVDELQYRITNWCTPKQELSEAYSQNDIRIRVHRVTSNDFVIRDSHVITISISKVTNNFHEMTDVISDKDNYYGIRYNKQSHKVLIRSNIIPTLLSYKHAKAKNYEFAHLVNVIDNKCFNSIIIFSKKYPKEIHQKCRKLICNNPCFYEIYGEYIYIKNIDDLKKLVFHDIKKKSHFYLMKFQNHQERNTFSFAFLEKKYVDFIVCTKQ